MKRICCFVLCCVFSGFVFGQDLDITTNKVSYFVYSYGVAHSDQHVALAVDSASSASANIKELDGKVIADAIKKAKASICGSNENIDARVWMSFGAHGEVGIGASFGTSMQSGFEITFHCGKIKQTKG